MLFYECYSMNVILCDSFLLSNKLTKKIIIANKINNKINNKIKLVRCE